MARTRPSPGMSVALKPGGPRSSRGYVERMADDWISAEASALADFVLNNVIGGIRPLMAQPVWPPALTEAVLRGALRPNVVTTFTGMIQGGSWTPKTGWKTEAARKARSGKKTPSAVDLSDDEVTTLIWRVLATEMPEADLSSSLGITRSQVLTAASTLAPEIRAQIGIA